MLTHKHTGTTGKDKELSVLTEKLTAAQTSLKKSTDDHAHELSKCKIREEVFLCVLMCSLNFFCVSAN